LILITLNLDIHWIGRKIKAQQIIQKAYKRQGLYSQSGFQLEIVLGLGSGLNLLKQKKRKHLDIEEGKKVEVEEIKEKEEIIDPNPNPNSNQNINILADLRGISNENEKKVNFYASPFYCNGGEKKSKEFIKKYEREKRLEAVSRVIDSAITVNSTTAMDFERYEPPDDPKTLALTITFTSTVALTQISPDRNLRSYLTVTAAQIEKGSIVLDPFAGSGSLLNIG
jgi:hypothetical protein